MLSQETKLKLSDLLIAVADFERQVEIVRQILCEQKEFEPYAAFKRIDRQRKGFLTGADIQKFLADNHSHYSEKQAENLINSYDYDEDGRLNYSEFLHSVLPMDNPALRAVTTQRPVYIIGSGENLPYDVEYSLTKLFDR